MNKREQILEEIINNKNLCLHNWKSQIHLDPSSGLSSAIDLTLSEPSIFIDYNWRVYKDPCVSDYYPVIMENSTIKKLGTTNKTPTMAFQKNKLEILQKTMPYHTNPRIKYKPIIHFTNTLIIIANKTIPKITIFPKSNKSWFTEECKNIRKCQVTLRKFKTNPSSENINKYKQQRAKTQHTIKGAKRSFW